ncbi:hypothetical protein GCM10020000_70750 [Streptomyces olivoverticillatus]
MSGTTPPEADFEQAPGLLDGATTLTLTADQCDLAYWLGHVAQGTLASRAATGHAPEAATPDHMREDGPLRDALILELGFRSVAEEKATRILSHYVASAPRHHGDGVLCHPAGRRGPALHGVPQTPRGTGHPRRQADPHHRRDGRRLHPQGPRPRRGVRGARGARRGGLHRGGRRLRHRHRGGARPPAAELSERKWDPLDPAAGEIARGTAIDEIRHLAVGSSIIREHLLKHPEYRPRLAEILERGRRLWDEVPDEEFVMHREELFQEGMLQHADLVGDYEVWPGKKLIDTTPRERYDMAEQWTDEMAAARMAYMGITEPLTRAAREPR